MGQPAARAGDMHVCPMLSPAVPPVPHVGGPVLPPGAVTVLIGNMPAARATDMCTCVGPPDVIAKGSAGVMIMNLPAARMGDLTAHGGSIVLGLPTVLIGEVGGGGGGGGGGGMAGAADSAGAAGANAPTAAEVAQANQGIAAEKAARAKRDRVAGAKAPAGTRIDPGFTVRGQPAAGSVAASGSVVRFGVRRAATPMSEEDFAAARARLTRMSGDPQWPKDTFIKQMLSHGATVEDVMRQFTTYLGMFGGDVHAQQAYDHDRGQEPAMAWILGRPMTPPNSEPSGG